MPKRTTGPLGRLGEKIASRFLVQNGYRLLFKNFRSPFGEIDIVAVGQDTLVFIEVKTRRGRAYGSPEEAITPKKLNKIRRTGEYVAVRYPNLPKNQRIDLVAIDIPVVGEKISVRLIKNISG